MKAMATEQKLRGGYYTPLPIAAFLAAWAIQKPHARVLEPSCGDGALLEAAVKQLRDIGADATSLSQNVHGIELDAQEWQKSLEKIQALADTTMPHIIQGDFFSYCKTLVGKQSFDAIIGNPPFIRYQNFPEEYRRMAFYLMQTAGLHPNRLTNAWVPFLVASTLLLNHNGRLGMVIPAELLQVNYAAELRYFLSTFYSRIYLITFKKLVFAGIQQEVVLLLAEKNGRPHAGIRTIELDGIGDLTTPKQVLGHGGLLKEMDHTTEKWTMYFLNPSELALLRALRNDTRLPTTGQVMDIDVGVVTGLNDYFTLTETRASETGLTPYCNKIVGRSNQLSGLIFSDDDWSEMMRSDIPGYLLTVPDKPIDRLPKELQEYIAWGESQRFHTGYKCRIRKRWYIVPSTWIPHAFMLRQIHGYPKIIANQAGATSTDTIHRVKIRSGEKAETIAAAFHNSLTFAFSEVIGRSYGGGVLELEPNEAEDIPIPLIEADALDIREMDRLIRAGKAGTALDIADAVLLRQGLGLSAKEALMLRRIWEKLRDRRINRRIDASLRRNRLASVS